MENETTLLFILAFLVIAIIFIKNIFEYRIRKFQMDREIEIKNKLLQDLQEMIYHKEIERQKTIRRKIFVLAAIIIVDKMLENKKINSNKNQPNPTKPN